MKTAAKRSAELCHVNLARGFRGGERQTELLVRALRGHVPSQLVVVRRNAPLERRFADLPDVRVVSVSGRLGAVPAMRAAALIHAHENGGAQAAFISYGLRSTPYIVTRRVDNMPKAAVMTRLMYQCASTTVVLSSAIGDVLKGVAPKVRCRLIPSASSDFRADPTWVRAFRARYPGKTIVGHVGAFDFSHKGQNTLLEAAAVLEKRRPELHFVLVGSGKDEARVHELAGKLANVDVVGWVDNVGDYLAAFDVFVMPSIREGLGSILLDAMQFGLPIVATGTGGIPDVVRHGENGLLVSAADPAALADALERLAADVDTRGAMAATNRRAAAGYSATAMAEKYLEVYRVAVPSLVGRAAEAS